MMRSAALGSKGALAAKCSVALSLVLGLLVARCSFMVPAPSSQPGVLAPIAADKEQLVVEGRTFEVRGVNYIRPTSSDPLVCPELQFGADPRCPWDIAPIAVDMERLQSLGINVIRVFLNYYVFGGARATDPSYDITQPLAHLIALVDVANRHDIYVMPVLLAKYPQDRFGPVNYAAALDLHVRPVVEHLANRPGLIAWDLFNEPDIGSPVDIRCWDWDNADFPLCFPLANERLHFVKMLYAEVKRLDPHRLATVSLAFAKNYFEPADADLRLADVVDFYAFHYYDNDPYDSGRYAAHWYYGEGFPADKRRAIVELIALGLRKPIVVSEVGFPTGQEAKRTPVELRRDLRISLQVAREEQISGIILWPFQDRMEDLVGDLFEG